MQIYAFYSDIDARSADYESGLAREYEKIKVNRDTLFYILAQTARQFCHTVNDKYFKCILNICVYTFFFIDFESIFSLAKKNIERRKFFLISSDRKF